jgi:hypothetical protein
MEDVLDVYTQERDEKRPLVCMDECPKQIDRGNEGTDTGQAGTGGMF